MTAPALSKSLFKLGLTCPLKLKHALAKPALPRKSDEDDYLRQLALGGYMFEKLVKVYYPGQDLFVPQQSHAEASARTLALIKAGDCTLHEATFAAGGLMARTDMVRVSGDTLDLIEIKSASAEAEAKLPADPQELLKKQWAPYVVDLAYQVHVARLALEAAGLRKTIRAWFYLPNKQGVASPEEVRGLFTLTEHGPGGRPTVEYKGKAKPGDSTSLIAILEATAAVAQAYPGEEAIADAAERLSGYVATGHWPAVELGMKCKACEFNVPGQTSGYDLCWGTQARAEHHLFTLGYLGSMEYRNPGTVRRIAAQAAPRAPQITDLQDEDVAGDAPLQRGWKRQIMAVRTGRPFISPELVRNAAALLRCQPEQYPLFFLDYEGTRCALPSAAGCRPYGQVAFQWSCHVIDNPGASPRHVEWLDTEHENPNLGFLESLRKLLGEQGTIYHWADYEVTITQELAQELRGDEAQAELVSWVDRNWGKPGNKHTAVKSERCLDLLEISRGHFYDPAMKGSHSIKKVLPVVWKNPAIQKLFPKYAVDQHGQPVKSPYDALPALTLQDAKDGAADLSRLDDLDVVKNGTGAMRAYEHVRYGLAAADQAARRSIRRQLMRYCELDTAAIVMIWKHWLG
ncbi:MAG: DUF2779 domain-containing protein [Opitutales bacterium]